MRAQLKFWHLRFYLRLPARYLVQVINLFPKKLLNWGHAREFFWEGQLADRNALCCVQNDYAELITE